MKTSKAESVSLAELTPPYARVFARLIRPFPNFDFFFVRPLRRSAVQKLQLKAGDRVLDAGCGLGGSFQYLVDAVSASGEVVGVEISPVSTMAARKRIETNGWKNVRVVQADARTVDLAGAFDAVLMLGAPDVYASPAALSNLAPHFKRQARVVAFGAKLAPGLRGKIFNSPFRWMFSKATFASTPKLEFEPWTILESRVADLTIEEHCFGWMFLAWGVVNSKREG